MSIEPNENNLSKASADPVCQGLSIFKMHRTLVACYHCIIHGLRIKDGKATYVSQYVKTRESEGAKFMKLRDLKDTIWVLMVNMQMLRAILKVLNMSYGFGTSSYLQFLIPKASYY